MTQSIAFVPTASSDNNVCYCCNKSYTVKNKAYGHKHQTTDAIIHQICLECLGKWHDKNNSCPTCRQKIVQIGNITIAPKISEQVQAMHLPVISMRISLRTVVVQRAPINSEKLQTQSDEEKITHFLEAYKAGKTSLEPFIAHKAIKDRCYDDALMYTICHRLSQVPHVLATSTCSHPPLVLRRANDFSGNEKSS